uniref:Uncharacterized protein n=1 Tax=Heliothis virescens TaxID=7102 RepID=A0A2A4K524_HELVI
MAKKINYEDGLPSHFCYLCSSMLHKIHKFKEKCYTGEMALNELLWSGNLNLSTISQINKQNKTFQPSIDLVKVNKRVRTCIVKSKTMFEAASTEKINNIKIPEIDTISIDSDNSLGDKNLAEIKTEIINNHCENMDFINNEKIDIENITVEEKIIPNLNLVVDEKTLTPTASYVNDDDRTFSNDDDDFNDPTTCDKEQMDNKINIVNENMNLITEAARSKNTAAKKTKMKKSKTTGKKAKKFEVSMSGQRLDPKHWLKIILNEEEAMQNFMARSQDPKYLKAAFKCTLCYKGFSTEDMLNRHKIRHSESLGPIECRFCQMRFKIKCLLTRHIEQHYHKYKCLRCDVMCPLLTTATFHNDFHNGVVRTCKYCGEEFRHQTTYYTHLRTHRSEYVCTLCGVSFVSDNGLKMHKNIKHLNAIVVDPTEQKNTYCEKCDIKFETRTAYDQHVFHSAKHAEEFEVPDDVIPALAKGRLRKYVRRNQRTCTICNKMFMSLSSYMSHHNSEHKDQLVPPKETERQICEICGASLAAASVASHLNTHTREIQYSCPTCRMQFTTKASMKRHQLINYEDGLPSHFCYLCSSMLHKIHKFKEKCYTAEMALNKLLWGGNLNLSTISQMNKQNHTFQSTIDFVKINKRVRTCIVKSKTMFEAASTEKINNIEIPEIDTISLDSDNSSDDKNLAEIKTEIIDNHSENIDFNNEKVYTENIAVEEEIIPNLNVDEKTLTPTASYVNDDDRTFSNDDDNSNDESTACNEEQIKNKTTTVNENINLITEIPDSENTTVKKQKMKKSKTTGKKAKKFEVDTSSGQRLDPKHWLKIILNEEEAMQNFMARSQDPKYLKAAFKCTLCYRGFSTEDMLNRHKIRHSEDPTEQENTYCEKCDIKFETRTAYDQHVFHSTKHAEEFGVPDNVTPALAKPRLRQFVRRSQRTCTICNKSFFSRHSFKSHLNSEHKNSLPPKETERQICEICGASLAAGSMATHLKTHKEKSREIKYSCPTCRMQFTTKASVKRHQLTHTGEKPHECTLCEKRFKQKCSMKLHYRTVHLKEPYPKRNRRKKPGVQEDLDEYGAHEDPHELNEQDGLPQYFCYECATILHKFHKFKEKCFNGQKVLRELTWRGDISYESIYKVDREKTMLISPVTVATFTDRIKTYMTKDSTESDEIFEPEKKVEKIENIELDYFSETSMTGDQDQILDFDEVKIIQDIEDAFDEENIKLDTDKDMETFSPSAVYVDGEKAIMKIKCEEIKEKKTAGRDKWYSRNVLNNGHWKKFTLSEEEALKNFRARAQDKKYLNAAYKCTDCFKGFSKKDMLDRHTQLRHIKELGPYECRFCRMRYKLNCYLSKHMRQHYTKYECLRCHLVCPLENSALVHDEYHSGITRKCDYCDEEFKHSSTYYTHLRTHRSAHVCRLCGASFVSAAGLHQHKRVKHIIVDIDSPDDDEEVNTYCQRCDITFETRKAYEEHLFHSALHSETDSDYKQEHNKKVLGKKEQAKITKRLKKRSTTEDIFMVEKNIKRKKKYRRDQKKPTTCHQCGAHFATQAACWKHHVSAHPRTSFYPPAQRYICEICGSSLAPGSIKTHKNMHTREKLHTCDTCGKQFYAIVGLRRHLLVTIVTIHV